jgi:hypothetical protein
MKLTRIELVTVLQNFFSSPLLLRQNKLECFSLEFFKDLTYFVIFIAGKGMTQCSTQMGGSRPYRQM